MFLPGNSLKALKVHVGRPKNELPSSFLSENNDNNHCCPSIYEHCDEREMTITIKGAAPIPTELNLTKAVAGGHKFLFVLEPPCGASSSGSGVLVEVTSTKFPGVVTVF